MSESDLSDSIVRCVCGMANIALHGDPNRAMKFQQNCPAVMLRGRFSEVAPQKGAVRARERRR